MNDARKLPPLTEPQMEILHCLWRRGEATVTEVWQELSAERELARNTVLTVMDRLAKRGWLNKRAVGNTHLYKPTVDEKAALGNAVERLVNTAFAGAADRLVLALLDGRGVTAEEAARIREMIDKSRKSAKKTEK